MLMENGWTLNVTSGTTDSGKKWVLGLLRKCGTCIKASITVDDTDTLGLGFQCPETCRYVSFNRMSDLDCQTSQSPTDSPKIERLTLGASGGSKWIVAEPSKYGMRIECGDEGAITSVDHFPVPFDDFISLCRECNSFASKSNVGAFFFGE